jgi:WD40 repeat protein
MLKRLLFVSVLAAAIGMRVSVRAQDDPPPYIYYYSDALNAFVIERADGSDSRLFGERMMPPDTNVVAGPGWSPSGNWFAWTSLKYLPNQPATFVPHALFVDGSQRLTALNAFSNVWMAWSPTADVLLIIDQDSRTVTIDENTGLATVSVHMALVDAVTDSVIASLERRLPYHPERHAPYDGYDSKWPLVGNFGASGSWSADGQDAVVRYGEPWEDHYFQVFDLNGTITERKISEFDTRWNRAAGYAESYGGSYDEDTRILVNLITGERTVIDPPANIILPMTWHPDGRYALGLAGVDNCEHDGYACLELWLLDVQQGTLQLTHPDTVLRYHAHHRNSENWSPDGRYFVFINGSTSRFAYLDMETMDVTEIPVTVGIGSVDLYWQSTTHVVLSGDRDSETPSQALYIYDCELQMLTQLEIPHAYQSLPRFSPDEQLAAFLGSGLFVFDVHSRTIETLPPDSRSYFPGEEAGEVIWDPSGNWLLLRNDTQEPISSGTRFLWNGVATAHRSIHREMDSCGITSLCIDWLPAQVDPANLAPGHDPAPSLSPDSVLLGTHWAWYLSWSPDGTRLLAGRAPYERHDPYFLPGESTLWDVTTGQPVGTFPLVDWNEEVEWITDIGTGYIPHFRSTEYVVGLEYLAFSPDGSQRVTRTGVEDTVTSELLLTFDLAVELDRGGLAYIPQVNYSPDGRLLAVPTPNCVSIWDTTTWQVVGAIDHRAQAVAFSPDGRWLAASHSWDIQIWDVAELLGFSVQR